MTKVRNKAINITVNMLVKNEDRFIWYAIRSVLPYIDKMIIFDTGSTDKTRKIIKLINSDKIKYFEKEACTASQITNLRNEQIKKSPQGWIWLVDGDEIYTKRCAEKVVSIAADNQDKLGIIIQRYDLLGDIYHYQNRSVGVYEQFGRKGHFVLRLLNKKRLPGLQVIGDYPNEYFADKTGSWVKKFGRNEFVFIEERIFHAMYLSRSRGKKVKNKTLNRKTKIELGKKIPKDHIPSVFFEDRPLIVPNVAKEMDLWYKTQAFILTPLKRIKRYFLKLKE